MLVPGEFIPCNYLFQLSERVSAVQAASVFYYFCMQQFSVAGDNDTMLCDTSFDDCRIVKYLVVKYIETE